jgi:hypothetical protein
MQTTFCSTLIITNRCVSKSQHKIIEMKRRKLIDRLYNHISIQDHSIQPTTNHESHPSLNIIRSIETIVFPAYQLFESSLIFNHQALFVGKMQKTDKAETCADV